MKKVLCTGIAGFLGQNLCRALLKKGYSVSGIDNLSIGTKEWLPDNITTFYEKDAAWVLKSKTKLDFDIIVHLASRKIPRYGDSDLVLLENARSMEAIAVLAARTGAKLIYLSSSDIYGKQLEFNEGADSVIGAATIPRWSYAISKMWSEQLIYGLKDYLTYFNIIRLFGSYGPYHALSWTAGPQSVFISQALKQEPLTVHGDGTQSRCFQYVDDAVNGIMLAIESDKCNQEVFNIGNPDESITINELAIMIWNMINPDRPVKIKYTPHSSSEYDEVMARVPDISKARKLLGFEPKIDLAEGLKRTIEWQKGVIEYNEYKNL